MFRPAYESWEFPMAKDGAEQAMRATEEVIGGCRVAKVDKKN